MASDSVVRPTAAGLRALSHPTRLKILMLLRLEGPATATSLAGHLALNTGATSYHLRQLAEHGFIEEDGERGDARDRWWKASHESTHAGLVGRGEDEGEDVEAYLQTVALMYTELLMQAVAERVHLPQAWQRASQLGREEASPCRGLGVARADRRVAPGEQGDQAAPAVVEQGFQPAPQVAGDHRRLSAAGERDLQGAAFDHQWQVETGGLRIAQHLDQAALRMGEPGDFAIDRAITGGGDDQPGRRVQPGRIEMACQPLDGPGSRRCLQGRGQRRGADPDPRPGTAQGFDLPGGCHAAADHQYRAVTQVGEQRERGGGHGRSAGRKKER